MRRTWSLLLAIGVATSSLLAQGVTDNPRLLTRRYVEGTRSRHRMGVAIVRRHFERVLSERARWQR